MALDGFGAFVANVDPATRRGLIEVHRQFGLYLPLAGGTMTGGLILPAGGELTLASTDHPLQIGPSSAANLGFDVNEIQARSNGAAATLELNPHGGTIQLGAGGSPSQQVRIGDDTFFTDINVGHTLGLQSTSDSTRGSLKLGSSGPTFHGLPTYYHLASPGVGYYDADTHYFRSAASSDHGRMATDGLHLKDGSWFRSYGTGGIYFATYAGGLYMADTTWVRVYNGKAFLVDNEIRGSTFKHQGTGYVWTHSTDTDTGIYYDGDGSFRLLANGTTTAWIEPGVLTVGAAYGSRIRLYSTSDDNHHLRYSSDSAATIHPASGKGSNGPWLQGYDTVCLRTVVNSRTWLFDSSGNAFTPNSWTVYSSRRNKKNIESLSAEESLDQVRLWRPVSYTRIDDGVEREGFIAEELLDVTPDVVVLTGEDNLPTGVAYDQLTVRLTGAVQALLARIETLEARIAELEDAQ